MGEFLILASVVSFGISNVLWKYPLQKISFLEIIILRSLLTTTFFGIMLLAGGMMSPQIPEQTIQELFVEIGKAVSLCTFSFVGIYYYVKSLKEEKIAVAVPVSSVSGLFGVLTAALILKEGLTVAFYLSAAAFLIGVYLVNGEVISRLRISKGVLYNLYAAFFWGVSFALFIFPVKTLGVVPFSFVLELTVCVCSILLFRLENNYWSVPLRRIDPYILVLAVLGFFGVIFYNQSFSYLAVSLISLLSILSPVISVATASILFKERLTTLQYAGGILILIGLLILNGDWAS